VLADYIFRLGTSKQASDFELVPQFIINHIRKEYEDRNDVGDTLEDQKEVDFDKYKPSLQFSQDQDQIQRDKEDQESEKIFKAQVRVYIERKARYESNKCKAFTLIYEQCNKTLQAKMKARQSYETKIKGELI
jgi:hypothetical protein